MSRSLLSAAVFVGLVGPAVFAAAPPDGPLPSPKIQALIEQLGDRDYRARDTAEKKLRDEGAAALPQLRKALKHKDLEVRRRALRLVPSIETAVLFAPKRVTFSVRDEPIDKVLVALSKASGYQINDNAGMGFPVPAPQPKAKAQAPKARTFRYDFVNEPFWDAVERICKDAGLSLQQSYGDDVVRLYKTNGHAPFVSSNGPFRVVASTLQSYRNVDLSSSQNLHNRADTLTLNFTVWAEPRLPLMNAGEARLDSAYDDLKNSLVPRRELNVDMFDGPFGFRGRGLRGGRFYSGGYKQLAMQVSVPLERRSERATVLKVVKGVVPMTVLVKQEPIVLSDKILTAKGVKKEVGDLTFEIQEAKKAGANQVSVKFTITNKKTNDYNWQNNLYNRLELFDDKGNKYQHWGSSWGGSGPGLVQMTLTMSNGNAPKPGEPAKFAFIHWETKQYDVGFEFRDVPLP